MPYEGYRDKEKRREYIKHYMREYRRRNKEKWKKRRILVKKLVKAVECNDFVAAKDIVSKLKEIWAFK